MYHRIHTDTDTDTGRVTIHIQHLEGPQKQN